MRKYLFLILLILPIVTAIQSNPSSIDADVLTGQPYNVQLQIHNNHDFTIYNISLEETQDITFGKIGKLNVNETKNTTLTILASSGYEKTVNPKIKFDYYAEIPQEPDTYEINITANAFIPSTLSVYKGDKGKWFNSDIYDHRVRQNDSNTPPTFDFTLQQNQYSDEITFGTIGEVSYSEIFFDIETFSGTIVVGNKSGEQITTNPDLYLPLNIHINSQLIETSVSLDVLDKDFTIRYNETGEGALRVSSGNERAFNTHLEGEWMEFLENDFDLEKNSNNLLLFRITPIILEAEDTNKTYKKTIILTGSNFNETEQEISIFVPYANIPKIGNATSDELIEEILRLKELLEKYNFTGQEPQIIYKDPEINLNLSASELRELLLNFRDIASLAKRTANTQKTDADAIKTEQQNINNTQNEILSILDEQNNRIKNQTVIFWGVIVLIAVVAGIFYFFHYLDKYETSKVQRMLYFGKKDK